MIEKIKKILTNTRGSFLAENLGVLAVAIALMGFMLFTMTAVLEETPTKNEDSTFDTTRITDMRWMFADSTVSPRDTHSHDTTTMSKQNGLTQENVEAFINKNNAAIDNAIKQNTLTDENINKLITEIDNVCKSIILWFVVSIVSITVITGGVILILKIKKKIMKTHKQNEKSISKPEIITETSLDFGSLLFNLNIAQTKPSLNEQKALLIKLEKVVKNIYDRYQNDTLLLSTQTNRVSYYLETTDRLLETYISLDTQKLNTVANIAMIKAEIITTLPGILLYFEELLNRSYEADYLDIHSDIVVINQLLDPQNKMTSNS